MNLTRINIVLAVLLVITSLLAVSLKVDYSKPNIEFLPTMVHSPAYQAYAANPNFPNGRTLQAPVPGTIPRGDLPLYYTASKEDAVRAGLELKNPFALDAPIEIEQETPSIPDDAASKAAAKKAKQLTKEELAELLKQKKLAAAQQRLNASIKRGEEIFNTFCITCHGPAGMGDGLVTKRGFPPPPPLPTGKSTEMKDGQLFHILTYGQGSMAPMISQLSRSRRWDVINYVRTLQKGKKPAGAAPVAEGKPPAASEKETNPVPKTEPKTKPKPETESKPVPQPKPEVDSTTKPKPVPKEPPKTKPVEKAKVDSKSTTPDPKTAKPEATGKTPKAEEKKP